MNEMNVFTENGNLNENGKKVTAPLASALEHIFASYEVKDMSIDEMRSFGASLAKIVKDEVSNRIQGKLDVKTKFGHMTDDQFNAYLRVKYGKEFALKTLTPEEFDRLPLIPKEVFDKALEEGRKASEEFMRFDSARWSPDPRYK